MNLIKVFWFLIHFVLCRLVAVRAEDLPPSNYALKFPEKPSNSSMALVTNVIFPGGSKEFSISMWMKESNHTREIGYFYYATEESFQSVFISKMIDLWHWGLDGKGTILQYPIDENEWFHWVFTWSAVEGRGKFYFNGKPYYSRSLGVTKGYTLKEKGNFSIGVYKDQNGKSVSYFEGTMTEINVWNKELQEDEVEQVYNSELEGNILAWSKTVWSIDGKVAIVGGKGATSGATPAGKDININLYLNTYMNKLI